MTVYILFHETNTGHSDESDGYIEGVYESRDDADEARHVAIRAARDAGYAIYYDPDTEQERSDWEHDWHVEEHMLRYDANLPTEGFFDFLNGPTGMEEG